jgi:hypothetical protein
MVQDVLICHAITMFSRKQLAVGKPTGYGMNAVFIVSMTFCVDFFKLQNVCGNL